MDINHDYNNLMNDMKGHTAGLSALKEKMEEASKALQEQMKNYINGETKIREGVKYTIYKDGRITLEFENKEKAKEYFDKI